jgi:hypothetical protein
MHFKLKIVYLKKDRKWWSPWSLPTQKQKISIHESSFRRNNKEANFVRVLDKKKDVSKIIC